MIAAIVSFFSKFLVIRAWRLSELNFQQSVFDTSGTLKFASIFVVSDVSVCPRGFHHFFSEVLNIYARDFLQFPVLLNEPLSAAWSQRHFARRALRYID